MISENILSNPQINLLSYWVYYKIGQIIPGQNCVGTIVTEGFLSLSLGTGESHGCAISPSKNLYCWGLDNVGQLGDGNILKQLGTGTCRYFRGAQGENH